MRLNEIFLFFWLGWLLIIVVYFFVETNKRFFIVTVCLLMLFIQEKIVIFPPLSLHVSFIVLCCSVLLFYAKLSFAYRHIGKTLMIALIYAALLLWEKVTPVWFVMSPLLIIPFILGVITVFLSKHVKTQIVLSVLGFCIGQLAFGYLLYHYQLHDELVPLTFFNLLFIHLLFLLLFQFITILYRLFKINVTT